MSMRSELGKVRGLGAAHEGTGHFWQQRLTAVINLPLVVFFVWYVADHIGADRAAIVASFKNPLVAFGFGALIVSTCWHMKLGLQMIIEDYVHGHFTKFGSLIANNLYAFGLMGLGLLAILKMFLGN
ncbi:succinate dehydrogenase, hydrophobic membrane anchor protein [Aestuariivirga litoralis]|uniref:succinate dehydrogenase, hydrophobic membrane anchor protein n=1 Tax=Aestuariivirga litoralis TaxID=2650924 RepID=UPI0018C85CCC|nr:succinate dehydrogenase, hydrophobic membrane anchor protein [Aestuariivirga litoralis]MBG1230808.1 succinate dehydrogenase, hydrophobic membrane anchor protein [Aestuariivirga litoralis]